MDHTQNPVQACLNFSLASLLLVQEKQFILLLPPLHLLCSGTPDATSLTVAELLKALSTATIKHEATQLLNLE